MIIALFSGCFTYIKWIKWDIVYSDFFQSSFSVEQGSALSPILFALCIDHVGKYCSVDRGHHIILYADDIGLSHARPNSGISGDLLSENEANPVVI